MDVQPNKDNYFDTGSLAKPPRFNKGDFPLRKNRTKFFYLAQIPRFHILWKIDPIFPLISLYVPATATTAAIPERTIIKNVTQWTDEDKRLVNIGTKAISLLSMSMSDDVFHSVCHLKISKEIWDTLRIQYEEIRR